MRRRGLSLPRMVATVANLSTMCALCSLVILCMYSSTCCVTRHKRIGYNVGGEIHSRKLCGGPRLECTSEMVHHRWVSPSEQQTAQLLVCHGTHCLLLHERNKPNLMTHK